MGDERLSIDFDMSFLAQTSRILTSVYLLEELASGQSNYGHTLASFRLRKAQTGASGRRGIQYSLSLADCNGTHLF